MRVSVEWLREFTGAPADVADVAARLTMVGLEVEGQETVDGDEVLEVNVTPNRPDCLSMLGIAREVASAFRVPLRLPETSPGEGLPASGFRLEILAPELCSRYTGRLITGVRIGESPDWMKRRLEKYGIRSLNNVVDITNYVLVELGHPLHAFDADRLAGGTIRVGVAGPGRKIKTLDGIERALPDDALLIWDASRPVAIAGIMGGEESSVDGSTRNVFLESAHFNPLSIRRTSKLLGLKSESSYRFERGTDIEFLEKALNRAALLMRDICGGSVHDIADAYPRRFVPDAIEVPFSRVNDLLGTSVGKEEILHILGSIGMKVEDRGDRCIVSPPAFRRDVSGLVDVVEEVARCYGFDRIPVSVPRTALSDGAVCIRKGGQDVLRESFRKAGFTEVINYSFMNRDDLDRFLLPGEDERRRYLVLKNPLRQEEALMRTMLLPSLVRNLLHNFARGIRDIRLFEIARVFLDEGERLPRERLRLGGVLFRDRVSALWRDDTPSFYLAKGALEGISEELRLGGFQFGPAGEAFLHSGKAADVTLRGEHVGFVGELSPSVIESLNMKVQRPEVVVFELDADAMLAATSGAVSFTPLPRYPAVERDVALVIDDSLQAGDVTGFFRAYPSAIIEHVEVFDCYRGKNLPPDKKSLAFRIVYRSGEKTLTDDEVDGVHSALVAEVLRKTGGALRGA